jgi:hypothetical protein
MTPPSLAVRLHIVKIFAFVVGSANLATSVVIALSKLYVVHWSVDAVTASRRSATHRLNPKRQKSSDGN